MDNEQVDESTTKLCEMGQQKGYFPSAGDQGRAKQGNSPFLTPLYFSIKLLDRYMRDEDYYLNWYTETTGSIGKYDEWSIKFGLNDNNNIHVWLGDLEDIPEKERARFYADEADDNKPSFNFVRAELMCAPAELPKITKLFRLRESLNKSFFSKFNAPLFLDKENSSELFKQICRPLLNSKEETIRTISKINKLFTESINISKLKEIINDSEKTKGKGSIKILEITLKDILKMDNYESVISPFYILDDFRISDTHAGTQDKFKFCLQRLNLNESSEVFSQIYSNMLDCLLENLALLDGGLQN